MERKLFVAVFYSASANVHCRRTCLSSVILLNNVVIVSSRLLNRWCVDLQVTVLMRWKQVHSSSSSSSNQPLIHHHHRTQSLSTLSSVWRSYLASISSWCLCSACANATPTHTMSSASLTTSELTVSAAIGSLDTRVLLTALSASFIHLTWQKRSFTVSNSNSKRRSNLHLSINATTNVFYSSSSYTTHCI